MKTENIIAALSHIHPLTEEFSKALQKELVFVSFPKNHLLLEAGGLARRMYFLETGFAISFYYHAERKVSIDFWKPGDIILSPKSFFQQIPSTETIQLMEESDLFFLTVESANKLFEKFTVANRLIRAIMADYHRASEKKIHDLHSLVAWERYRKLLLDFPGLEQQVSQDAIASFLGVTPQSLSRLKAKKKL